MLRREMVGAGEKRPVAREARMALPGAVGASRAVPSTVECSTLYRVGLLTFWSIAPWPSSVAHRRLLWRAPGLTMN